MDTPPAAQPLATQVEQEEPAAAKAIILTRLPLGKSSPKKAPRHKAAAAPAAAPSQEVQGWGVEVRHPNLKAPPKELVLVNQEPPQSPNMGSLGLEVLVVVGLEVVIK